MAANPFDQFDASTQAPAAGGGNPFDQFDKPATAATAKPSGGGPITDTALAGLDYLGMGLGTKNPFMEMPAQFKQDVAQSHKNLGVMDFPLAVAAYTLGPGKILGPAGEMIGGAGIGGAAAEGALAGGISDFDPNDPVGSVAHGALMGGALGGAAGGIAKGAGKLLTKTPQLDPTAVVAQTKKLRDDAYAPLKDIAFNPNDILSAHTSAMLTPGMAADVSPGMTSMLKRQQQAITSGGNTANDIADYVTNLRSAGGSPSASNGDKILAGQTADNLEGLLSSGQPITPHAPGDAMQTLTQARAAHARYANAQQLQQLQQQLKDFGQGPGSVPQTQAETYYKPGEPGYQAWSNIAQGAKPGLDPSFVAGHLGSEIGESIGGLIAGVPGLLGGKALGYLGGKFLSKTARANLQNRGLLKLYQAQYPALTGVSPSPPTTPSPMIGDLIKSLLIGGAY